MSLSGLRARVSGTVEAARRRSSMFDQAVATVEHYGNVEGSVLAGAVTYFGFLSFFPVLALAFAVVGYVARAFPAAKTTLVSALESIFPGLVGAAGSGAPIHITTFTNAAGTATIAGLLGLLYSGLGWVSGLRGALQAVFTVLPGERRNFVVAKVFDLVTLVVIGMILLVSVALSSGVTGFLHSVLSWTGLAGAPGMSVLFGVIGIALGVAASTALFMVTYTLLPKPDLPRRALLQGAFFAAVGFELLKLLAAYLVRSATQNPAFALLGISLVLLVWINYFSRVALLGAAWAAMSSVGRTVVARHEVTEVERIVAGHPEVPAQVGTFRTASTPEGAAAPQGPSDDRAVSARRREVDRTSIASGAMMGAASTAIAMSVLRRARDVRRRRRKSAATD